MIKGQSEDYDWLQAILVLNGYNIRWCFMIMVTYIHNVFICDSDGHHKVNICTQIVVINNDLFVN